MMNDQLLGGDAPALVTAAVAEDYQSMGFLLDALTDDELRVAVVALASIVAASVHSLAATMDDMTPLELWSCALAAQHHNRA